MSDAWLSFLRTARPSLSLGLVGSVLCLDPGGTTGWALFVCGDLIDWGQQATPSPEDMADLLRECSQGFEWPPDGLDRVRYGLDLIVYEEYRVRGNKFKEHVGSEVVTIQHIGAIKVVADELGLPLVKQTAGMAKGFATDAKLRRWGLYQPNKRHANDAIRHGCYWLLFAAGRGAS